MAKPLTSIDYAAYGIGRTECLQLDPASILTQCAALQAIENSGLTLEIRNRRQRSFNVSGIDPNRAGVIIGTGIGGAKSFLENHDYHILSRPAKAAIDLVDSPTPNPSTELVRALKHLHIPSRFNPLAVSMLMPNALSANLGIKFGFHGRNQTICLACASGTAAVGVASRAIQRGELDVALTGGAEYLNDPHGSIFRGFDAARTLVQNCDKPEEANRPFDVGRSGFLFAEGGSGVLVLENLERANKRGASIIAEIVGFAESFDAFSMMSISPGGEQIERMMDGVLEDAKVSPSDISYINSHGTGTEVNDREESNAIRKKFGAYVLVNATKSLIGHTIGASGALETIVTALTLRDGSSPLPELS